jgi:hypothetical protein
VFSEAAVGLVYIVDRKLEKQGRQCMYVQRNNEARLCNCRCSGKAISIAYSEYVFVALCIQHAMWMRHIVICGLPDSTVLFHIIS